MIDSGSNFGVYSRVYSEEYMWAEATQTESGLYLGRLKHPCLVVYLSTS